MGRELLLKRLSPLITSPCRNIITFGINSRFQELFPTWGQITHAFLTLAPLRYCYRRSTCMPTPCRQRSLCASIKSSKQKNLIRISADLFSFFKFEACGSFNPTYFLQFNYDSSILRSQNLTRAHRTIQFSKNFQDIKKQGPLKSPLSIPR